MHCGEYFFKSWILGLLPASPLNSRGATRAEIQSACATLRPFIARTFSYSETVLMSFFRWAAGTLLSFFVFSTSAVEAQQAAPVPRPVTVTDVFSFLDLNDPQISPDGKWVAYTMCIVNRDEGKNEERILM